MHQDLQQAQAADLRTQVQQIQFELKKLQTQYGQQSKEIASFHDEVNAKFTQVASRLAEKKLHDQKIQELVDRHNQVIKTFEVRLVHFQNLLLEKERLLAQTKSELNSAKMEISRIIRENK